MKESAIEQYLVKRVKEAGGQIRKVQWVGRRGAPDRLVLLPGRAPTYVELKRPGEKPRVLQEREHRMLEKYGASVVVIDSIDGVDALMRGRK